MDASELNVILEGVLTVATVVLAFYTASMANQTRRVAIKTAELSEETKLLAQETVAATRLSDRHHQEAMTPCIVRLEGFVVPDSDALILRNFRIKNVGPGLALNVRLWIGKLGEQMLLPPLGADEAFSLDGYMVRTGTHVHNAMPIEVELLYSNLFGAEASTTFIGKVGEASLATAFRGPKVIVRDLSPHTSTN